MSAADEQAREVEVVARALGRAHGWTDEQLDARQNDVEPHGNRWCLWVDDAHSVLASLEPIRAAERQEARADALEDAARRVRAVKNMPPGYTVDPASLLDELAENCRDRADGVTGRSET